MAGLTWTDANGNALNLNDGTSFGLLVGIEGVGVPPVAHRVVVTPDRDGAVYVGTRQEERFVVATVLAYGASEAGLAALRRTLAQRLNPSLGLGTLRYTPGATAYDLRAVVELVEPGTPEGYTQGVVISWRAPDPLWRATSQTTDSVVVPNAGLVVPVTVPVSLSDTSATDTLANAGDAVTYPTVTVAGPLTAPKLRNSTTGQELHFSGLVLAGGETLVVNMEAQTALVGSTSVLQTLSAASVFWGLAVGNNTVVCSTSAGGATFQFAWYSRYEGV